MIANFVFGNALATVATDVGHQEPDADDQVVALTCRSGQVRDVVAARLREEDAALDAELLLRVLDQPLVGEEVERAVVETADVGHERDLVRGLRRCGLTPPARQSKLPKQPGGRSWCR